MTAPVSHLEALTRITAATETLAASDAGDNTLIGAVTETAPTTDTASSGLNGRLQRIAQRITSLIALLPTALGAGGGLKVDGSGTALPVSGTVTANVGTYPGRVSVVPTNPTTTATPYSIGDAVGSAITFTNVVAANGGSGRIDKLLVRDYMNTPQNAALELWLFTVAPTGITGDNSVFNVSDGDLATCIGPIPTGSYAIGGLTGTNAISRTNPDLYFTCDPASRSLTGWLVSRGTPTYGADATSLGLTLGVSPA